MAARFVHLDHDTPLLLPPDLRDWISKDDMVHFIMDSVDTLDLTSAKTNERGPGSAQYPPATMRALLIYCSSTGTFASRRIETLTYENVAVRSLCADTHPDHDSICKIPPREQNPACLLLPPDPRARNHRFAKLKEAKAVLEERAKVRF